MGVVNVTPDSFSDGGVHLYPAAAVASALGMLEEGAAIVDVGGESTRPGSDGVSLDQELGRVVPVLEGLAGQRSRSTRPRPSGAPRGRLAQSGERCDRAGGDRVAGAAAGAEAYCASCTRR
jgi:hypothetical protein